MLELLETESPLQELSRDKLTQLKGFVKSGSLSLFLTELERTQAFRLTKIPVATPVEDVAKLVGEVQANRRLILTMIDDYKQLQAKE